MQINGSRRELNGSISYQNQHKQTIQIDLYRQSYSGIGIK